MKKHSFKQILVIVVIALIVILDILAFAFALSESDSLHTWAWICFILSLVIPLYIFFHLKVLDFIRKTHEYDAMKKKMSEQDTEDETND